MPACDIARSLGRVFGCHRVNIGPKALSIKMQHMLSTLK